MSTLRELAARLKQLAKEGRVMGWAEMREFADELIQQSQPVNALRRVEELKPCQDRMRFRNKVAAPSKPSPGLLPCPFCEGTNFDAFIELEPPNYGRVRCVKCGASVASTTLVRAVKNWNTRPVSELERLAREVYESRR